jgi:hypothetical protein
VSRGQEGGRCAAVGENRRENEAKQVRRWWALEGLNL